MGRFYIKNHLLCQYELWNKRDDASGQDTLKKTLRYSMLGDALSAPASFPSYHLQSIQLVKMEVKMPAVAQSHLFSWQ